MYIPHVVWGGGAGRGKTFVVMGWVGVSISEVYMPHVVCDLLCVLVAERAADEDNRARSGVETKLTERPNDTAAEG